MNPWSSHTLKLVTSKNYLDRLQEIYPHEEGERDVDESILKDIKKLFEKKDDINLLNKLLVWRLSRCL